MSGTLSARSVLRQLLAEKGIDRFALFLVQQEGKELPGGIEAMSGFVLTSAGEIFGFWLDWDPVARRYVLDPWYQVSEVAAFQCDAEYHRARRELGLES